MAEQTQSNKTVKGYKIIVIVLAVILAALTYVYFMQVNELRGDREDLTVQRDTLISRLSGTLVDLDNLKTENDTINASLVIERERADSLFNKLKQERSWSQSKIREYEREIGTLRAVTQNLFRQIDSLNTINQGLIKENTEMRRNQANLRLQAEKAEERAKELDIKVQQGAIIRARNIALLALNNNNKEVTRANRAARLRVDLVLTANELATPGDRVVYVRVNGPDGHLLANSAGDLFDYEGEKLAFSASRQVDYDNKDLDVSIYYNGGGIVSGKYTVSIYMDGQMIGTNEVILK